MNVDVDTDAKCRQLKISVSVSDDETLQQESMDLFYDVVCRLAEAALIDKKYARYRKTDSMDVSPENLIKRFANNLVMLSKSWSPYGFGLVDRSEETRTTHHNMIASQMRVVLSSRPIGEDTEVLANDIAEVLLRSWNMSLKPPGRG